MRKSLAVFNCCSLIKGRDYYSELVVPEVIKTNSSYQARSETVVLRLCGVLQEKIGVINRADKVNWPP